MNNTTILMLGQGREGRIPCPRRVVMWRKTWTLGLRVEHTAVLVKRLEGMPYSADLDAETPYFLEIRDGAPPVPGEGLLGPLLCRLDLDGEVLLDRPDAEPVLYGEAPDEVLLVAELSLEAGAWTVERVRP